MTRRPRVVARMTDLASEGWCEPLNAVDYFEIEIRRRKRA